jgi:hypothetical protein
LHFTAFFIAISASSFLNFSRCLSFQTRDPSHLSVSNLPLLHIGQISCSLLPELN